MNQYWKSILAFLSLVATNEVAALTNGQPLPQTASQWIAAIVTTVVGTFLVWVKANAPVVSPPHQP